MIALRVQRVSQTANPLNDENPLHEWVHECKRRRIDLKGTNQSHRAIWRGRSIPAVHSC
jgi:hypothetical protein